MIKYESEIIGRSIDDTKNTTTYYPHSPEIDDTNKKVCLTCDNLTGEEYKLISGYIGALIGYDKERSDEIIKWGIK